MDVLLVLRSNKAVSGLTSINHASHSAKPRLGALPTTVDMDSRSLAQKLLLSVFFWMWSKEKS